MNSINLWLTHYLVLVIGILLFVILINFGILVLFINKLKKYRMIFKPGNEGKDFEALLLGLAEKIEYTDSSLVKLIEKFSSHQIASEKHLQKINLLRFKAFENTGGDQSFALAILDSAGDGVVISSIFGREESRVYCKPIEGGTSKYAMSAEEKEAINRALVHPKN